MNNKEKILAIMKENAVNAHLATIDGDQPRVRPVTPIVENDLSIWIMTSSSSRKVDQIRKNPQICLSFVELPQGSKAATVIGEAEIVTDREEKKRIWNLAPFDPSRHFPEGSESNSYCLLKIAIKRIEWRDTYAPEEVYELG